MLQFLRDKAQSPVFQGIIIIIVLVFLFWVPKMSQGNRQDTVATVNGQDIPLADYQKEYNRTVEQIKSQLGDAMPKGFIESLGIKDQVLQRLIQQTLMIQGAEEMGLHVSDWEISQHIKQLPYFLTDGTFDEKLYKQLLEQNRLTPKEFEESQRQDLLAQKVTTKLAQFGQVTPWEIDQRFAFENNEIQLMFVQFSPENFVDEVEVNDQELAAYFQENKDHYQTDPQAKIKYLAFTVADAKKNITISDEEAEKYYHLNISSYQQPERRQASHILLKTDPSNDQEKKNEAADLLAKLKDGADFATMAKEISEDPGSALRGGDLGFFAKGQMVPSFEQAVFSLEEGEISEVIKTNFGYHIIKLSAIQPAATTDLALVMPGIKEQLLTEKAKGKAFEDAGTAYEKIFQAGSLSKYTSTAQVNLLSTDFFSQVDPPVALQQLPEITNKALSLQKGDLSSLIEGEKGYFIIFIEDRIEPTIPEQATVQEEVIADFKGERSKVIAKDKATEMQKLITAGKSFDEASQELAITSQETPLFSRQQQQKSNLPESVAQAGFMLTPKNPVSPEVIEANDSYFLVTIMATADQHVAANANLETFTSQIQRERQRSTTDNWLDYLMKSGDIRQNPNFGQ